MSFDIEKMKADGVSEHLIYLATVAPEVLMIRVARRLENDRLFQQFMSETASEIEKIYPYAIAAGLMSEADRLWLVDAENPYKPQDCNHPELGTLIYCGSASNKAIVSDECDEGVQEGWCNVEKWHQITEEDGSAQACATGVFDGNIVSAEVSSTNAIRFGTYLEVVEEINAETGDTAYNVSELQGASHYAIYTKYNSETGQCEE